MAGIGWGKSMVLPRWHHTRVTWNLHSAESLVVAPNYRLLKNRCLAEYEAFLNSVGMREGRGRGKHFVINQSSGDMKLVYRHGHMVHFLSGNAPEVIISYNASHIALDEPATMEEEVITRLVGRLRCPRAAIRQIGFFGTPEGINWYSERFDPGVVQRIDGTPWSESPNRLVLHGSSYDNPYLPESYLRMLEEEYGWDPALRSNYILGIPMSMSRNRFYFNFDNKFVGDYPPDPETRTLYLSFDNNVTVMTWAAIQPWEDKYLVVADNGGQGRNIEHACEQFVDKFPPGIWKDHNVVVLGDAALWARSTHSNQRGYEIIRDCLGRHYTRLSISAPRANPHVEERSRCTNRLLSAGRLLVDRNAKRVIQSAQSAETDPIHGIKKPSKDTVTHAMEAVDMALLVLSPSMIKRQHVGIK